MNLRTLVPRNFLIIGVGLAVCVAAAIFPLHGFSQNLSQQDPSPSPHQDEIGALHGTVLFADSKAPVTGIDVHVMNARVSPSRTSATGAFEFTGLAPGALWSCCFSQKRLRLRRIHCDPSTK